MKKFFLIATLITVFAILTSCEKDEVAVKAGIVYTDTPDPEFFKNKNIPYCQAERCWLEISDFENAQKFQYGSFVYYNSQTGQQEFWEQGEWRVISARKYWYMIEGVHYTSSSIYYFLVPSHAYYNGSDLIKEFLNLRGYLDFNTRTTFGGSTPVLVGYEEYK